MAEADVPAKFKRNRELRQEIALAVGIEPRDRYVVHDRGLRKRHLQAVARKLDVETNASVDELSIEELYKAICRVVGSKYQGTAGNQWRINRPNLKRLHRVLVEGGNP